MRYSPMKETRSGHPSSHTPIRTERSTPNSRTPPLGRNETIWSWDRPLNRETLNDRLTPLTPPQRTTDHPNQPIERGDHDSQTSPEDGDARINDEPFHHEAHGASASVTTTRKPVLRAYTARVIERPGKRDTVAETHFKSDLSSWMGWYVIVGLCHAISHNVNTILLQHAPNLFNLLLTHTTNANATVNLAVNVLNNFELKRDTIQAENDLPAQ